MERGVDFCERAAPLLQPASMRTAVAIAVLLSGCGGGSSSGGNGQGSYSIGGSITGLTASGLVLANGNDTVSPASGSPSFTFPTAAASGSTYDVTIKAQPTYELCQIAGGTGQVANTNVMSVQVTCTRTWTWVSGSSALNAQPVYGTRGVAAVGNVPGARSGSVSWSDHAGKMWLFGGFGYASAGSQGWLNDLWMYDPGTGLWTWMSGSNGVDASGVYGAQGAPAVGNVPGARDKSVSWTDSAGDMWLYGGYGYDAAGNVNYLNDLWRYSPSTGLWTWISGWNIGGTTGVYGTQGVAAAGNMPGARSGSVSWIDSGGNLWLFGGLGFDAVGPANYLNDLWRYSPASDQWAWVSGSNSAGAKGAYGTQGVAAAGNVPSAREASVSWIDHSGNLWLFGGGGIDSAGTNGFLNDLWNFSPATQTWIWVSGSNTVNAQGSYGTLGVAAAGNVPGARSASVSWTDSAGDLWLFGDLDYDDLWRFSPSNSLWTWVGGSNTTAAPPVYGTQGVAAPDNVPGARDGSVVWVDGAGEVWLFGGYRGGATVEGPLNDLWLY
jgi:N-acetylneuraminic acid mutarotase